MNEILVGECSVVMNDFPDKYIDMVLTSPPYDELRTYNGFKFDFEPIANSLFRVMKMGGVVVWVVGDSTVEGSESGSSFRQALYFKEIGFNIHDTMIYRKNGPAYPSKTRYHQIFEYMFILSKGSPKTFNPIKDRKNKWYGEKWGNKRTRRNKEGELTRSDYDKDQGGEFGNRFNIWKYNVGHGYQGDDLCHEHPASFPELLARDQIVSWSEPGDLILDPMCGSGTVLKMAIETGRKWIGIEISEEYADLSRKRIEIAQPPLFV